MWAVLPELPGLSKADYSDIYGRYRVCRNCRSIAENAGIVESFHILDMYVGHMPKNELVFYQDLEFFTSIN